MRFLDELIEEYDLKTDDEVKLDLELDLSSRMEEK